MAKRSLSAAWAKAFQRNATALGRRAARAGVWALTRSVKASAKSGARAKTVARTNARPPPGAGQWLGGVVSGLGGIRRYWLFRPPGIAAKEALPLLVMLHGCGQNAAEFAASTRMNAIARRERFLVLYPEQDRLANPQGCWNWYDTDNGRAYGEAALIIKAIDQLGLRQPVDLARVAVVGLSAGASMAALLAARHPERFKAVVMHSGVPVGAAHNSLSALAAMRGRRVAKPLQSGSGISAAGLPHLLVIQGEADPLVVPANGRAAAEGWAAASLASAGPVRTMQRGQRYPFSLTEYQHAGQVVVAWVEVARLSHAWSGGAPKRAFSDPQGPDASRMLWQFVAKRFNV